MNTELGVRKVDVRGEKTGGNKTELDRIGIYLNIHVRNCVNVLLVFFFLHVQIER